MNYFTPEYGSVPTDLNDKQIQFAIQYKIEPEMFGNERNVLALKLHLAKNEEQRAKAWEEAKVIRKNLLDSWASNKAKEEGISSAVVCDDQVLVVNRLGMEDGKAELQFYIINYNGLPTKEGRPAIKRHSVVVTDEQINALVKNNG